MNDPNPALVVYIVIGCLFGGFALLEWDATGSRRAARVFLTCWAWPLWIIALASALVLSVWKDATRKDTDYV